MRHSSYRDEPATQLHPFATNISVVAGVLSPFISILENLADVNEVHTAKQEFPLVESSRVSFHQLILPTDLSPPIFPPIFPTRKEIGEQPREYPSSPSTSLPPSFGREMDKNLDRGNASPFVVINRETLLVSFAIRVFPSSPLLSFEEGKDLPRGRKFVKFRTRIRTKVFKSICELLPPDVERNLRGEGSWTWRKKKKGRKKFCCYYARYMETTFREKREKKEGARLISIVRWKIPFNFFLSVREFLICLFFPSFFFPSLFKMQNIRAM